MGGVLIGLVMSGIALLPMSMALGALSLTSAGEAVLGPPASPPQAGDRAALLELGAIAGLFLLGLSLAAWWICTRALGLSARRTAVTVLGAWAATYIVVTTWH